MRAQIAGGTWKPGDRLPSYNEARALYNVHTNTLEKAYSQLENEGLIVRRRGSGTFVAEPITRTPGATGIVGLCGVGFNFCGYSPYWAQLQGGVREAASQAGMQLLLLDPRHSSGWEKADGVLLCDWNDPLAPRKTPPGMAMVSLMTPVPGIASVCAGDEGGARAATEYLLGLGHRRIGFLHTYAGQPIVKNRLAGYRSALRAAGIRPRAAWLRCLYGDYIVGRQFTKEARRSMSLWLREDWKQLDCTALLCHNDEAATGAIAALNKAGLRVPDDVSVVGFDGTEYCDLVSPRLSTVEVPLRAIGAAGVELLLRQFERAQASDEHRVLPTRLAPRATAARYRRAGEAMTGGY
jgi:LacI family repressor for deo operon, udp, cdd, tsx, nupC, and nupG